MGPWLIEVNTKEELALWLAGGPPDRAATAVMLVRGDGPTVRVFLPNALDAAKRGDRRAVVWLKDPGAIDAGRIGELFGDGDWCLAVVLGTDGRVVAWVSGDRIGVEDAEFAFAAAPNTKESEIR